MVLRERGGKTMGVSGIRGFAGGEKGPLSVNLQGIRGKDPSDR